MSDYDGPIKPGYFKLRDQVHTEDQAGVPANLRATTGSRDPIDHNKRPVTPNSRVVDPEGREAALLRWIRQNPGKRTSLEEIMNELKYNSTSSAHRLLKKLEAEGKLTRSKKGHKFKLYPVTLGEGLGLDRDDERNGEVRITRPATPVAQSKIEEHQEEQLATTQAAPAPSGFTKVLVQSVDDLVWKFVKVSAVNRNNEELSRLVRIMLNFAGFVGQEIDGVKNETKEETPELRPEETGGDNQV